MASSIRDPVFPELKGRYIFGDYETRRIWSATITKNEDGSADSLTGLTDLVDPSVRIVAFGGRHVGRAAAVAL